MNVQHLQQWASLVVPSVAMLAILGIIMTAYLQERRNRDAIARQQAQDFEQHRRML